MAEQPGVFVVLRQQMITGGPQVMSGHTWCSGRVFRHSSANELMVLQKRLGAARPPLGRGTFACSHFSLLQTLSVSVVGISGLYLDISFSLFIVSVYKFKICVSEELIIGASPLQRPKLGLLQ